MAKCKKKWYKKRMKKQVQYHNALMKWASFASVSTAVFLIVLKFCAYLITGSMAILSSLLDSVQDAITSLVNLFAIRHAIEPADAHHRFGHGKAQALGSLGQSVIIALAGLFLISQSVERFLNPQPIHSLSVGLWVTVFAIFITLVLVSFQNYVIRKTNSLSLRADRAHYAGDVMMNVGVIISMLFAYFLHWDWVDALFGVGVGFYLLSQVWLLSRESFSMLMDTEIPQPLKHQIKEITMSFPSVLEMTQLKTRYSGNRIFIQFALYMDDDLSLKQAHDLIDKIEKALQKKIPEAEIIIHPEPISHKRKV